MAFYFAHIHFSPILISSTPSKEYINMVCWRSGEMAQQLRALAAVVEDSGSILSVHMATNSY